MDSNESRPSPGSVFFKSWEHQQVLGPGLWSQMDPSLVSFETARNQKADDFYGLVGTAVGFGSILAESRSRGNPT